MNNLLFKNYKNTHNVQLSAEVLHSLQVGLHLLH